MLAEMTGQKVQVWKSMKNAGQEAFIPGVLYLLMALDNGWEIARVENTISLLSDKSPAYLVTLDTCAEGPQKKLIITKSALVDKILDQNTAALTLNM
jgi:hypothetical protein